MEHRREHATPTASQDELLAGLDEAVEELLTDEIAALGFGLPSPIDQRSGRALQAVNIPLQDIDFRTRMKERFGLPVGIENDANAATYAEFRFGAARDVDTTIMLTLGTGCGGGAVDRREALPRVGRVRAHRDRVRRTSRARGPARGAGIWSRTSPEPLRRSLRRRSSAPRSMRTGSSGWQAREKRVPIEILDGIGRRLGAGIGSLVNIFHPELVVIGGGFAAAGDFILDPAREIVQREALARAGYRIPIVRAELGTAAGLIGAGLVAFDAAG